MRWASPPRSISLLAGDRLWRRGQTVFAQGIIGLGLALLYLSIYAAAMLYQLLPPSLAFIAMCGVTAGAAGLAVLLQLASRRGDSP